MSPGDAAGEGPGGVLAAAERRAGRLGGGAYAFLLCLVALAAVGVVGLLVKQPYLFPSLGPTVMLFFETPTQKTATPRSTLVGHGVAILAGAGSLALFGLTDAPPILQEGITGPRIGAAALSLALTALVLRLLSCPHPPAGATTLIVSLGLLTSATEMLAIAVAVVLLTVLSVALNRLLGVAQPLWS
jgi:CBS-domain-containing membrane protein